MESSPYDNPYGIDQEVAAYQKKGYTELTEKELLSWRDKTNLKEHKDDIMLELQRRQMLASIRWTKWMAIATGAMAIATIALVITTLFR